MTIRQRLLSIITKDVFRGADLLYAGIKAGY